MPRVTTIDKGFDILEALAQGGSEGMGVRALARQLDINVTSAHNMCRTLSHRGYVWQDPTTRRYQLGLGLALLAQRHLWQRLLAEAEPHVYLCQQELGESILLATTRSHEMITLVYLPSSQALRVHEPPAIGERAYGTAVGKVLLSSLDEDQLVRYLQQFPPRPFTDNTLVDPQRIRAELQDVRSREFAQTRDELTLGVSAVAVPIRGPHARWFAALGASAPTVRMDEEGVQRTRSALVRYAQRIEGDWFPG